MININNQKESKKIKTGPEKDASDLLQKLGSEYIKIPMKIQNLTIPE